MPRARSEMTDEEAAENYCGPGRNGRARTIEEATRILSNREQAINLVSDELHSAFLAGVEHGRRNPITYDAAHETKEGWASWVAKDEREHLERIKKELEK